MRPLALVVIALAGALSAGCSDPVEPTATRPARVDTSANTFEAKARQALYEANLNDIAHDQETLRKLRRGDDQGKRWPQCQTLARDYAEVAMSKTLAGVQEALIASQVDDFVLCDKPAIHAAARAAAETAVQRLAPKLPARQMVEYMVQKAPRAKMDDCWLKALRTSRQDGSAYSEAYQRAEARCKLI